MTIYSMTGFAKTSRTAPWGTAHCELRSLNHRHLDIKVNIPDQLKSIDANIYQTLRNHLARGSVECRIHLNLTIRTQSKALTVNEALVQNIIGICSDLQHDYKQCYNSSINLLDLLKYPGVIVNNAAVTDDITADIMLLLAETIEGLIATKAREGAQLQGLLMQQALNIRDHLAIIRDRVPAVVAHKQQQFISTCHDLGLTSVNGHISEHLAELIQAINITEETDRLAFFITEIIQVLSQGGLRLGRRLDFLLQESQRETNTIGAKINDLEISAAIIEIKVLIDQMREQINNVQ